MQRTIIINVLYKVIVYRVGHLPRDVPGCTVSKTLKRNPFYYYTPLCVGVFLIVPFPHLCQPILCTYHSSSPYMLEAPPISFLIFITRILFGEHIYVGPVAQSVQRLTKGWTVRDRIPVGTRFSARLYRPWGPPSLLYNGYRVFPGGKVQPGRAADHSHPSSAAVMEEQSYTSTPPVGNTGPVKETL